MTDNLVNSSDDEDIQYYKPAEIAKMLSVTQWTVRSWITDGKLKAIKISNRYRIAKPELKRFLEERF